jgi:EpsI family protein
MTTLDVPAGGLSSARPSRRSLILGGGFAATAALAAVMTPRLHEFTIGHAKIADVIPTHAGPWSQVPSDAFTLPEENPTDGFYDQVFTRAFIAPGQPMIMLLIAYGAAQSGMMKVHRPEVCFTSAGFKITDDHDTRIPVGPDKAVPGKGFLGLRNSHTERVLYWTRISNQFPSDLGGQRLVMIERGLQGVIPDGVLVRLSTPGDLHPADTEPTMKAFVRELVANCNPMGKALLLGALRTSVGA